MNMGSKLLTNTIALVGKCNSWEYYIDSEIESYIEKNKNNIKAVLVAAPHSSNLDGFHCARFLQEYPLVKSVLKGTAKESLFKGLFGFLFGAFLKESGAEALNRSKGSSYLNSLKQSINTADACIWALFPEGSRSYKEDGWKYGFMNVMKDLEMDLLTLSIDYNKKICSISNLIRNEELKTLGEDFVWEKLEDYFSPNMAKHPEKYNKNIKPIKKS